ncbi:MAG: hypothetical protein OEL87_00870 [Nanoarchaeota archaeon]|nr:hypothetical protein [Nanoarchaeota archaeon]
MARIYLPKRNFDLSKNPHFLSALEESEISPEQYRKEIQPFLKSLTGFYSTEGPQLRAWRIFPKINFFINGLSLSRTLEYVSEETDYLQVPIQDEYSLDIESRENIDIDPDDKHLINRKLDYIEYNRQTGSINVSRVDGLERRVVSLGEISRNKMPIIIDRLSEEAIDNIIG